MKEEEGDENVVVDDVDDRGRKAYLARHDAVAPNPPLHSAHRYDDDEDEEDREEEEEEESLSPLPMLETGSSCVSSCFCCCW